jgi:decaprenylphospho-beta-D-ribofuranose 2-oxidase
MESCFTSLDLQTTAVGQYHELAGCDGIEALAADGPMIARGAGVSYVAASFGERTRSIGMQRLNRILNFEPQNKRITVEAGTSLGVLYTFLLPRRLYLAIQPGHPQISIGACVACNVHGKNPQRDGVFADHVESLELFHPAHGVLALSRQQNAELFDLTCGGFGLTGIILSVTLRLTELPATIVELRRVSVRNLEDACEQVEALKAGCDFLYTWNDMSTFDARMGRGYVATARFVPDAAPAAPLPAYQPLDPAARRWRLKVFRRRTIPWITGAHFHWKTLRSTERVSLFEAIYPGMRAGYYFDLYGAAGFFAHMVLVPQDRWRGYVRKLEGVFRAHREPITALSIKAFDGPQRLLQFNGRGFSMHSHVPNTAGGLRLIVALEDLGREFNIIRTIYFDSRLTAAAAKLLYPEYETFKERLHRFDPQRMFVSALSRRLDL